jgi:hypothetical protein
MSNTRMMNTPNRRCPFCKQATKFTNIANTSEGGVYRSMDEDKRKILEGLPVRALTVPVVGNQGYKQVLVDGDYDGEWFATLPLRVSKAGYVYTLANIQLGKGKWQRKNIYLHHLVLHPRKGQWISFYNNNPLDCRSANIVYSTPSKVALKRESWPHLVPKRNGRRTTTYRGVVNNRSGYTAKCRGQYLGNFRTAEDAARAYDAYAYNIWGGKAILNFPKEQ